MEKLNDPIVLFTGHCGRSKIRPNAAKFENEYLKKLNDYYTGKLDMDTDQISNELYFVRFGDENLIYLRRYYIEENTED
jgi:hypothetical protein